MPSARPRPVTLGWAVFVIALFIAAMIVVGADPQGDDDPSPFLVLVVVGFTAFSLGAMLWYRTLGSAALLSAESNEEIRQAYTRRMMVSSTFALLPTLLGFALSLATGHVDLFYGTFLISLIALIYTAPRKRDTDRLDRAMIRRNRPFRVSAAIEPRDGS